MSRPPAARPSQAKLLATLLVSLPLLAASARAQASLPMPRVFEAAIARGTRTADGHPGPKYWQNRARYIIDLAVSPPGRTVTGAERIVYVNASPDTLRTLVIKLFMNIHEPGAPRVLGTDTTYLTTGVHIDSFAVNDVPATWRQNGAFTSVPVKLATPIAPHDSVRLAFRWHYDIATRPQREGMIDSTTFYLAYFYPRVAVYDDYNGWDTMDFTDLQEFYSDFNDYDVHLRIPARFVVWGTGTLVNASDVLQPATFQRFTSSSTSDSTVHVVSRVDVARGSVTRAGSANTWHFSATNVPDVAFGVSDHYDWDAASVIVDSATRRRASVQAAYDDTAADFHHMVQMARHSLAFLSSRWPGVAYPYEKTTIFQGGAGMEYPMMVNDESYPDTTLSDLVAAHEIAHTYFPFYMGIDETRYAFMDEGWATTFEYLVNQVNVGPSRAVAIYQQFRTAPWVTDPSPMADIPIITPSDAIKDILPYRDNAYGKASLGYLAVKDFLGDATFTRALHAYMERWHGKHPAPWDFFNTFDAVSGRNLEWFWNDWYFRGGHIDIAVRDVTPTAGGYRIALDNVGGFDAPVDLVLTHADGSTQTVHETIGIWEHDERHAVVTVPSDRTVRSVRLSGGIWMDADTTNDVWRAK